MFSGGLAREQWPKVVYYYRGSTAEVAFDWCST